MFPVLALVPKQVWFGLAAVILAGLLYWGIYHKGEVAATNAQVTKTAVATVKSTKEKQKIHHEVLQLNDADLDMQLAPWLRD